MQITESGKTKYAETKRLIRNAMFEQQLVLFVGAGASVDSGMPLWNKAISQIIDKLDLDPKESYDNLVVPQYYYNARGRKEYTQLMRQIFRYNDKLYPKEIHNAIIRFGTETIITTNYDHLIEQAAEDNGEFLQVISQDLDLPYRTAGKELIKMHGDFEHDNFVLKEDDYLHYHKNFKLIENYVKSLIGTKTVLFIGYSLNDPDVKHIFSWVKEILDEHFQRAYLIITGRKANQNEVEYFRHLGVIIIYASELFDEKDIDIKNHSEQLLQTLNYLLDDGEREKGIIDSLYDNLKPFANMNFTYRKYIEKAFGKLRNKVNEHITLRIENDNYIEHSDNHAIKEDKEFLQKLDQAIEHTSQDDKVNTIAEVLRKSCVKGTRRLKRDGSRLKEEKKEFLTQIEESEWIEAISNFDYKKLQELKEFNSKILSEARPELYLQQAYICSFLGDYLSAYYCLDNAATFFYRKREYIWYFISLWNKRNVSQIIVVDIFYHVGIDKEIFDSIKQDYETTDLDKTLQSIPDLGHEHNQFLRDLKDFKFASDLFYDVFSSSLKASREASEKYFMYVGLPAYEQIRQQVYDYYQYGIYNCLQVDRYRENNEIFNLFARSMLTSVAAPDKVSSEESIFGDSGNVHADALNATDIHLILRYIDTTKLRKLFLEFNINIIEISDNCVEYLKEIVHNIADLSKIDVYAGRDIFWKYLCFVSHTKIDTELAKSIITVIAGFDKEEFVDNRHEALTEFINTIYSQGLYSDEELCLSVQKLMQRLVSLIAENKDFITVYRRPIIALSAFCREGGLLFDDVECIQKILEEEYYSLLPSIYTGSSDEVKQVIKDTFKEWECPDNARGYITYSELALAETIKPDPIVESNAFEFVLKFREEKQKELERGMRSFSENDGVEGCLVNLYLSNKIQDVDRLKEIVSAGSDNFSKWLLDAEGYDYQDFELSWLEHCYPSLLEKLAENEAIKHAVVSAYKDKYSSEFIDKKTNEIMVKYFI